MNKTRLLNVLIVAALIALSLSPAVVSAAAPQPAPLARSSAPQADRSPLTPEVSDPVAPGNTQHLPAAAQVVAPAAPRASDQIETRAAHALPRQGNATSRSSDTVVQNSVGKINMPAPDANFDGVDNVDGVLPPDTNGEVGKDHYVQMVNVSMAVYSKSGALLYGPFHPSDLWPTGDVCRVNNDGDPVVLYDQLADRWIVSQFALPNYPYGPFYECIAVSKAGTPTNNPADWYPYTFRVHNTKMDDYPKLSVWPDGYYMTVNQFDASDNYVGAGVFAFDRAKMLNGQAASFVYFDLASVDLAFGGMLPADLDGATLPPANAPAYFFEVDDDVSAPALGADAMRLWKFHVDWANPLSSTFGLAGQPNFVLPVASFDLLPCVTGGFRGCIPQQGTAQRLDSLGDRLMFRAAYRNFGGHESVMINHTVWADGTDRAGVRWYEVRNPSTTPTIYQQGTYAPADGKYRWMGSLAMDHAGNVALGYSTSSSSIYPSINYVGRLSTDPLNTMPQAEGTIINGSGAQTSSYARWGDYSDMTVDPVDDCTFWYTQEYIQTTGNAPWRTRIGSFVFPSCSLGAQGILSGTVTNANTAAAIENATIQATSNITNSRSTTTNASGQYGTNLAVGTYTVTASKYGFATQTVNGVTIADAQTTIRNFALSPAQTYVVSGTVKDVNTGWPLYAQIAVGGAYPGNPIWTNPATGYYSITLVAGLNYSFNVNAFAAGYQAANDTINNLAANTTLSFSLLPDLQSCVATGYAYSVNGAFANFDNVTPPSLPAGWSSVTVQPTVGTPTWATVAASDAGIPALTGSNVVYFNSAQVFYGGASRLTDNTPINLSSTPTTTLTFWMYHDDSALSSLDYAQVQVSTDGGSIWADVGSKIYRYDGTIGWQQHSVSLSAYAGQTIEIGFLGVSDIGSNIYLDDVLLGTAKCVAGQGGLVSGNVMDANTGSSLNGATVTNQAGYSMQTVANPTDSANPGGFYLLYAPSGTQAFTATQYYYSAQAANVLVPLNGALQQNFALPAGQIAYAPPAINVTQTSGVSSTLPVTLSNSGSAAAQVSIVELSKGVVPFGPFEKPSYVVKPFRQQFKDAIGLHLPAGPIAPPYAAGDILQSWPTTGVNSPWGIAYDARDNSVWVGSGWDSTKKIYEFHTNGTSTGRSLPFSWNPSYGPADATYNWNTDKLWIMNVGLSDNCIYEIDPSSGPTNAKICPTGPTGFATSQRGLAYDPATDTYFAGSWVDQMVYRFKPDGTLLNSKNVGIAVAGLAYNPATGHLFAIDSATTSKFYVLDVNNNYNLIGTFAAPLGLGGAGLEIDCSGNLWAVDQNGKYVYQLTSGESTNVCGGDVSWLSAAPTTATIAANATQRISVSLNAAGLQPGLYDAQLKFTNNTPYYVPNLPVKLTVNPPANWGKLSGNVSTLGYCDVEPAALAGVTVTIKSATGGTWSTLTDANGNYGNWFNQSYSPVTVTVNATGYQTQQYTSVNVTAGNVTVRDFVLRWLQPCVTVRPGPITVTLGLGENTTRSFFVANNGAASTPYHYTEQILAGQTPGISIPASAGTFPQSAAPASAELAPSRTITPSAANADSPLVAVAPVPAYGFDLFDSTLVKWTDLNVPGTWTTVGNTGSGSYFAADFLGADYSQIYAVDRYSNEFVTFNTSTLTRTLIGVATPYVGEGWSGLTGSTTGIFYASSTSCGSASSLYTINPATGAATRLGPITGAACIIDLAIDRDGNLYGLDLVTDRLYKIDTATGAGTPIGPNNAIGFDANYAQGMDFDQLTNVLYLAAYGDYSGGELRIADTTTGGSKRVGAFPNYAQVDGLAIATGLGITTDIAWLSETPSSGTLPADNSITTTLGFNANAVAVPGTYKAGLTLNTNDPYYPSRQSAMTFIVNAPYNWGVLSGTITTQGYCDVNPSSLSGAQITLQGASGAARTTTSDAAGHYTLWLDSLKNPYTMTVTAAGQLTNSISGLAVNGFGATTNQNLPLRLIQPCLTSAPDSLAATLPWGSALTQTLTLSNTGAGTAQYTITEKSGGFIPLGPVALPRVLVVNDNGPYGNLVNVEAFTRALTSLGYPYDVVDSNYSDGILGTPSSYAAVIYAGTPDTGAEQDQLMHYLDDGGRLLIADNELGVSYDATPFYSDYLEAKLVSNNGSKGTLAGTDIMTGISTNASADDYPNSFALNGPDAIGIFKNVAPFTNWAGLRIQRADHKAVYLGWDYGYTGSTAVTDTAKVTVLGPALNWLLAVNDVLPWLSENPISGTLPVNNGAQHVAVKFNAAAVTQPGTYYGALQVQNSDALRGTFRVPITLTVIPTNTLGKLSGIVTDLGYCDVNPNPFAYAPLLIQGRAGYSATLKANADGSYQQWLYQANSPYTVTVAAEGYATQILTGNVITGGVTTTLPINLRRAQPCVGVNPADMSAQLILGNQTTLPFTITNSGASALSFNLRELNFGTTPPTATPEILIVQDGANEVTANVYATTLRQLGFSYEIVPVSWYVGIPRTLSDYHAVIYIGSIYRGATYTQLSNYLDAGGRLLFSSNLYGIQATASGDVRFMTDYLEATYVGEFPYAANVPITGTDIMTGVNTTLSADPYPEYFTINGPHGVGIFANSNPATWTGERVDNGYRLIYLAWDFQYTGSTALLDPAKATILQRSLSWLLGDVPWLSENIVSGSVAANTGAQPISVTLNSGVSQITQPGDYYATLKVASNDPVNPGVNVPVTLTVLPPASWAQFTGTVNDLSACDVNATPAPQASVLVETSSGMTHTLSTNGLGQYQVWLPAADSPLTLTISHAGYVTQIKNAVSGNAGATIVNNFDLRLGAPCLQATPNTLLSVQKKNQVFTQTLLISNTGAAALNWSIQEQLPASLGASAVDTLPAAAVTLDHGHLARNAHQPRLATAAQQFSPLPDFNMTQNVSLTQSTSQDLIFGTSMACSDWASGNTLADSFYRVYDLATYGLTQSLKVNGIEIGIEEATTSVGQQLLSVKLYTLNGDFVLSNLTLLASANYTITDQVLTHVVLPITAVVPAGSKLVVEIYSPNLASDYSVFYLGANDQPETGSSYIRSVPCSIDQPTPTDDLGMPSHYIINVVGLTWPTCDASLPWVSASPLNGSTAANSNSPIAMVFNSNGLSDGFYTGNLCLFSNDQVQPVAGIPVRLAVGLANRIYMPLMFKNK